ncbi:MAG TPA: hypothetical protein VFC17_09130 [Candidatus Limnocylindrales bacterium]|nr:hypothetical protein [Candidatus Limnocylindrales bacterium]
MKKLQPVQVILKFARLNKDEFNSFALLAIVCLGNNALLFPNLPVTLVALEALQTVYQDGMNAAALGGPPETQALKEAYGDLVVALRQIAAYIQSLNLSAAQVLLSGYDVVTYSRNQITLSAPLITGLDNSMTTQLGVNLQAVAGAKAYQVQYCTGTGAWVDTGIWPTTKGIVITGLLPGTVDGVRVRGVGGSTQYGPWSATVSLMCT